MNFKLKRPCSNCPFRTDRPKQRGWLGYERAKEIANYVLRDNKTFTCHKTLDKPENQQRMCAGALSMLHNASREESPHGNAMVQIAERLGLYDPVTQNHDTPVFSSAEEMAIFHSFNQ